MAIAVTVCFRGHCAIGVTVCFRGHYDIRVTIRFGVSAAGAFVCGAIHLSSRDAAAVPVAITCGIRGR
jgi:hypothetical protein